MTNESTAKKILFIDDDEDLACAMTMVLEEAGYRVLHATDGDEGVRMADTERPDLILLDFMMPVKNGFDAFEELRRLNHLQHVPILALTAFGQNIGEIYGLSRESQAASIHDYLEKPVDPNVLLERVSMALATATA